MPITDTSQSFEKSAIPLLIDSKPSATLIVVIAALHTLACCAVVASHLPWALQALSVMAILASLAINVKAANHQPRLIWLKGNRWHLQAPANGKTDNTGTTDVDTVHAELCSIDFASRYLISLTLRDKQQKRHRITVLFDSVDEHTFRLLRVRLRIEGFALLDA